MARKGSSKVRTGCLTCKVRKVKCDEEKPHCRRCVGTGHKCDGYAPAPGLLWHRPRHLFPDVNDAGERRSLQFFCEGAAPFMAGPMDPYFWTHLVMQFSSFEPAVRHSVVALSALYEQVIRRPASDQQELDYSVVLRHYNSAIRELKTASEPLVLMVCVLFTCIDFLRGEREAAIEHVKHGVFILEGVEDSCSWIKEYLSPIFRRLSIFPFFFTVNTDSFAKPIGLHDEIPAAFGTFSEAQYFVDGIISRTIRLVRYGDSYRLGDLAGSPVPDELLAEQERIRVTLDQWRLRFASLEPKLHDPGTSEVMTCSILMRYEVARSWLEMAFNHTEAGYDSFLNRFRWMVHEAERLEAAGYCKDTTTFSFEMGFLPLLYYVVMRCRCLETRVRALSLMKKLGSPQENLFELVTMHAAGKRFIEIEHGALLDEAGDLVGEALCPGLPADEMRIRDVTTHQKPVVQTAANGEQVTGRMVGFYMRAADGRIHVRNEFVPVSPL
ncbi:Uu.00g121130.m01.CDS01 [Anthostomella pinea]|uniref:Uu.00g121130.m01.CDS01 n=1 Tax=Anthostomella pinea TaxID=933095 RepID=A0AAI8VHY9_9PEZI|nr:Uu.00g121130.m01.CDS01 [Anthostomella pinea]